ncbi:MAG: ProQ/FinO family protein [Candidatus Competibacteraceae bacterium]|jgi:ProP effector|nr:ProQ/FinO family protein [Candidatus Competibacteraceae bacterium]
MSALKQEARGLHHVLMQRFPKAFPKNYDHIRPLKIEIYEDIIERLGDDIDRTLLKRVLANHTERAGYLLAILHHRGDRRYDLDGNPVGLVDDAARAEATTQLEAIQARQKTQSAKYRAHKARERELQAAKAQRRAERERKAAEKQRRREEHERNRQRKLEREQVQQQERQYRPDQPALLQPRDPTKAPTPTVVYKKRRRIIPPKDRKE